MTRTRTRTTVPTPRPTLDQHLRDIAADAQRVRPLSSSVYASGDGESGDARALVALAQRAIPDDLVTWVAEHEIGFAALAYRADLTAQQQVLAARAFVRVANMNRVGFAESCFDAWRYAVNRDHAWDRLIYAEALDVLRRGRKLMYSDDAVAARTSVHLPFLIALSCHATPADLLLALSYADGAHDWRRVCRLIVAHPRATPSVLAAISSDPPSTTQRLALRYTPSLLRRFGGRPDLRAWLRREIDRFPERANELLMSPAAVANLDLTAENVQEFMLSPHPTVRSAAMQALGLLTAPRENAPEPAASRAR